MVITHTQQGSARPDHDEHEAPCLDEEPQHGNPAHVGISTPQGVDPRDDRAGAPATKEHRRGDHGHVEHVDVLGQVVPRELH